jgi:hypothetical protein
MLLQLIPDGHEQVHDAHSLLLMQCAAKGATLFPATATDVTVTFPFVVRMPAASDAAITAISLLTVPAASDTTVLAKYASSAGSQQTVPSYLWQHVYSMYGYGSYASNGEVNMIFLLAKHCL